MRSATSSCSRIATVRWRIGPSDVVVAVIQSADSGGDGPSPQKHLEKVLVARGLYPREAKAMVESWRGSWFEHGTRLFYIVSGEAVDAICRCRSSLVPQK